MYATRTEAAPRSSRNRTRAARGVLRAAAGALLATALLLVPAAGAAAFSWPDEPTMVAESNSAARDTFIIDPGQGKRFSREQLLDTYAGYFGSKGFTRNFLTWSEQDDNFNPGAGVRWAGCTTRGSGAACAVEHFNELRLAVTSGPIPALRYGGAFVALACGNFSSNGANPPAPRIEGLKFEDVNGNGARDAGEPGLSGWEIRLHYGSVVRTTTTDAGGRYSFSLDANSGALSAGRYTLTEVLKSGWQQSRAPGAVQVPFGATGEVYEGRDFGNYRPATIDGVKYEDMEADGDRDAVDPLLDGWTIDLSGGPSAPRSDVTDSSGAYAFGGLRPGTYTVAEQLQSGWRYSAPSDGSRTITVRSGDQAAVEFGNYRPAAIEGVKFDDHGVDGGRDATDTLLAGWTIALSGGSSAAASTTTDATGGYRFGELRPGTYTIAETLVAGWRQSAPVGGTHEVTVRSGDTTAADFGNVCLGSAEVAITDESTGSTIEGVTVRIEEVSVPGILSNTPILPRSTTGAPSFGDLLPGTYRVTAFLPTGTYTTDSDVRLVDGKLAVVKEVVVAECAATDIPITMFTLSNGKVTGGMRMDVPGGFATAGFVFMTRKGLPEGSLEYQDHATGLNLHSERIEAIRVDGRHAWIGGLVDVDGVTHRFLLHLVDNGEPGREDRFELLVTSGYSAGFDQTIDGGNDQIHPPEHS